MRLYSSVQFCGRFSAQENTVRFQVTSANAAIQPYPRIEFVCNAFRTKIESGLRDSLSSKVGSAIEKAFAEKLRVTEMLFPALIVTTCSRPDRDLSCPRDFSEFGGECSVSDGQTRSLCRWNMPVVRVEVLPSRIELVLAEDEASPLLRLLVRPQLRGSGTSIARMICRAPEMLDFGGSSTLDTNALQTEFLDNGRENVTVLP